MPYRKEERGEVGVWILAVLFVIVVFSVFGVPWFTGQTFQGWGWMEERIRLTLQSLGGNMSIVQLILAFILPPAAVYLAVGLTLHFWINVILTILGWVPGILHALWVMFLM
jgi:uncharacterized membrane protein YqaE (UPF0057 family)